MPLKVLGVFSYSGHVTGQIWPSFETLAGFFNGTNLCKKLILRRSGFKKKKMVRKLPYSNKFMANF